MPTVTGPAHRSPLAGDPGWRELRDAAFILIATRARQTGTPTLGDQADQRLVKRLMALDPPGDADGYMAAALWDLGEDLGRHVYSKPILEDDFETAIHGLSEALAASGLGRLTLEHLFHRTAEVGYHPPKDQDPSRGFYAYVYGSTVGALSQAFNCEVRLKETGSFELEIVLGTGRDVNREAEHCG